MRKTISIQIIAFMLLCVFGAGCSPAASVTKIGMLTTTGIIEDQSFLKEVWSGIEKAKADYSIEAIHAKPEDDTAEKYLKETDALYSAGYRLIVAPGIEFARTIYEAQKKYPDARFITIDSEPIAPDGSVSVSENTVALTFAEHEAGFLAAVAASLQQKTGHFAVILGSDAPSVKRFKNGFVQGVSYANKNYGTQIKLEAPDFVFINGYDDLAGARQAAVALYNNGVDVIFTPCGLAATAVIDIAKERFTAGFPSYVVATDFDCYKYGVYKENQSVILTSALKKAGNATYEVIKTMYEEKFPGGQTLLFSAKNDGIGLPEKNPNLREDVMKTISVLTEQLKTGVLVVNE